MTTPVRPLRGRYWPLLLRVGQVVAAYNSGLAVVVAPRLSVLSLQRRQREVRDELRSLGEAARSKPPGKKAHGDVQLLVCNGRTVTRWAWRLV